MASYASDTSVSVEKSRAELETILARYGAHAFGYMADQDRAYVMFESKGRRIRFIIKLPKKSEFALTPDKKLQRHSDDIFKHWERACRQRWRALCLVVKAKLEAVDAGISEFEEEFLAHIVLPNGATAGDWLRPQIHWAYETNSMPPMLPMLPAPTDIIEEG